MPMEAAEFEEVLQEALTERDMQLQEKELPEINIGEAIPVKEGLDFSLEYVDFGVSEVVGSVKDGIIGNKTNSLKTIDSEIEWLKAPVGQWAKAATWTQQEAGKDCPPEYQFAVQKAGRPLCQRPGHHSVCRLCRSPGGKRSGRAVDGQERPVNY